VVDLSLYCVDIETRGDDPARVTGEALSSLVDALLPHNGVVIGGGGVAGWGATITIESASALSAIAEASAIIRRLASAVRLPDWPVVRAVAIREDILSEDIARPPA
jgi:hypothetical protein